MPNCHYKAYEQILKIETLMSVIFDKDSTTTFYISGDFNLVLDPEKDSINRTQTAQEKKYSDKLQSLMIKYNLIDSYRTLNDYGGYTWSRNNPVFIRSRLDYCFISAHLKSRLLMSSIFAQPNESDHQMLVNEFNMDEVKYGPGILKCNSSLFENEESAKEIKKKVLDCIETIPNHWNPHQTIDFVKMNVRQIMLDEGKRSAKRDKTILEYSNIEIERLNKKMNKILANENTEDNKTMSKIIRLTESLALAREELDVIKAKETEKLIFRSRVQWAEKGEKSNKYFLNLLKERQKKTIIRKIISNGNVNTKPDEITRAITNFYKELYKEQNNINEFNPEEELFKDMPKLDETDKKGLGEPITLDELTRTLNTCKESAPGQDGITYDTYRNLWETMGPLVLSSWNYSVALGETSPTQKISIITLLEKKGKDKTKIENLRPISLSNCDIKLCTKALAIRTSKVVDKLVSSTQTGYVPGRQITDNNRLIEEIIDEHYELDIEAYLVTLDAQKAFDSVNHKYLENLLNHLNFPKSYISYFKTIYKNLTANILINGYLSDTIDIKQSVKQGDALSCTLFIIAIQPLINAINKNTEIQPIAIKTSDPDNEIIELKNFSFADDITALCSSKESINNIINEYNNFSKFSGIRLNIEKTEILILGKNPPKNVKFTLTHKGQLINIFSSDKV